MSRFEELRNDSPILTKKKNESKSPLVSGRQFKTKFYEFEKKN